MNPWRHTSEREPGYGVVEGLADRADLRRELTHYVLKRPELVLLEELKTLRFALACYGVALLTLSVASLGVLLYAVLE